MSTATTLVDLGASSFRSRQMSPASSKFRQSTHVIPDRIPEDKSYMPTSLWPPLAIGMPLIMLALGLALEVGIFLSNKNDGFAVPKENVFSFTSSYFLLSFVPTVLIIPFAFQYRGLDWYIRRYQPYVVLQRGNVTAEEGLLTDYISLGRFYSLFYSSKHKHRIIFWSSLTALVTFIFQPLAGSVFSIQQKAVFTDTNITSTRSIGLVPDVNELTAFVAAAGFAEAAVFNNLDDPPFVTGAWATAEFEIPTNVGMNGTVMVDTTGVQTNVNCENPKDVQVSTLEGQLTIVSNSVHGCSVSVPINTTFAESQYGVLNTSCGDAALLDVTLQPVMFWYFHRRVDNNEFEARSVFCSPTIKIFDVHAEAWLQTRTIASCTGTGDFKGNNNVTGSPLFGNAFNGVVFETSPDPFIQARATSTNKGVPGAIFRFASQRSGGLQSTFDLPNGFLDVTHNVYTQHLALTAKNIYFLGVNTTLRGQVETFMPRLVVAGFPGHSLAIVLFTVGLVGSLLHIINRRQRRKLFLPCHPGSIGNTIAMTSHSGFGQLLVPYDTEEGIEKKLEGLRFRLDRRTGAIVAEDEDVDIAGHGGDEDEGVAGGRDDALESLLGRKTKKERKDVTDVSSSQLASQAASGYPPWRGTPTSPGLRSPDDSI